jgi:hypothetical protein
MDRPVPQSAPLALAAGAVALLLGLAAGWMAHDRFGEPLVVVPPPAVLRQQLTDEAMAALCADLTDSDRERAIEAQETVQRLEAELSEAESALLAAAAPDEAQAAAPPVDAAGKARLQADVDRLRGELSSAREERDRLKAELSATLAALDDQQAQTRAAQADARSAKADALSQRWRAFSHEARADICDRGSKKAHARCHEAVQAALGPAIEERYLGCLRSGQAAPMLQQLDRKQALPAAAWPLPDDNRLAKGWIIVFCDPSLPEGGD